MSSETWEPGLLHPRCRLAMSDAANERPHLSRERGEPSIVQRTNTREPTLHNQTQAGTGNAIRFESPPVPRTFILSLSQSRGYK